MGGKAPAEMSRRPGPGCVGSELGSAALALAEEGLLTLDWVRMRACSDSGSTVETGKGMGEPSENGATPGTGCCARSATGEERPMLSPRSIGGGGGSERLDLRGGCSARAFSLRLQNTAPAVVEADPCGEAELEPLASEEGA